METSDEVLYATLFIGFLSAFVYLCRRVVERKRKALNDAATSKSGHYWSPVQLVEHGFFCVNCKQNLTTGYECDFCCMKVDEVSCTKQISSTLLCKVNNQLRSGRSLTFHHWVPGNIEEEKFCLSCDELCGGGIGLQDYRCSWCMKVAHTRCRDKVPEECQFGVLQRFIIPPTHVVLRKAGSRNQRLPVIQSLECPEVKNWCPVIVIVNPKSGSCAGKIVLRKFRHILHPCQVIDVMKSNIKSSLAWIDEHPHIKCRILIAGGDGTISLVMNDIDSMKVRPPVAVLPLGTGNDLSRILGWGSECDDFFDVVQMLTDVCDAKPYRLDRWSVLIEHQRKLGMRRSDVKLTMTNYISIGVDACVTLDMQTARSSIPKAMSSRLLNKFLFFTYGTKDVFARACYRLNTNIELYIDNSETPTRLPDIEGLVFLNIPSWGAGVKPWEGAPEEWTQEMDDGKFEIFAVTSSLHIAQLQVGLSSVVYVAQARKIELRVKNTQLPMQSDGEAWLQSPGKITITKKGVSEMLQRVIPDESRRGGFF